MFSAAAEADVYEAQGKPVPSNGPLNKPWPASAKTRPSAKPRPKLPIAPKKHTGAPRASPKAAAKAKVQTKKTVLSKPKAVAKSMKGKMVAKPSKQVSVKPHAKPKPVVKKWATEWQEASPNSQPAVSKPIPHILHSVGSNRQTPLEATGKSVAGAPAAAMEEHWDELPAPPPPSPPTGAAPLPPAAAALPVPPPVLHMAAPAAAAVSAASPGLIGPSSATLAAGDGIQMQAAQELNGEAGAAASVSGKFAMLRNRLNSEVGGPIRRGEAIQSAIHDFVGGARHILGSLEGQMQQSLGVL